MRGLGGGAAQGEGKIQEANAANDTARLARLARAECHAANDHIQPRKHRVARGGVDGERKRKRRTVGNSATHACSRDRLRRGQHDPLQRISRGIQIEGDTQPPGVRMCFQGLVALESCEHIHTTCAVPTYIQGQPVHSQQPIRLRGWLVALELSNPTVGIGVCSCRVATPWNGITEDFQWERGGGCGGLQQTTVRGAEVFDPSKSHRRAQHDKPSRAMDGQLLRVVMHVRDHLTVEWLTNYCTFKRSTYILWIPFDVLSTCQGGSRTASRVKKYIHYMVMISRRYSERYVRACW